MPDGLRGISTTESRIQELTPKVGAVLTYVPEDCSAKVWDLSSGEELFTLAGHTGNITALVITADGQYLISASRDATLKVWCLESGK